MNQIPEEEKESSAYLSPDRSSSSPGMELIRSCREATEYTEKPDLSLKMNASIGHA